MNDYLKNFFDLYSDDDSVVYKAILAKKDWMFKRLYMPCNFLYKLVDNKPEYIDLFSLMDHTINFEPLILNDQLFEDHEELSIDAITKFNEKYRVRYFYEKYFNLLEPSTFWVELDFGYLDDKGYKDLVANFYPCLSKDDLELNYDFEDVRELLKLAMFNEDKSYVAILDKNALINDRFYAPVVRRIIYDPSHFDETKITVLKELASNLEVELKEAKYE